MSVNIEHRITNIEHPARSRQANIELRTKLKARSKMHLIVVILREMITACGEYEVEESINEF